MAEGREAILLGLGLRVKASFGLPFVIGELGASTGSLGDRVGSTVAPISRAFAPSSFFSSCSNGEPFSIDPNGDAVPSRAAPLETADVSFGSECSISIV